MWIRHNTGKEASSRRGQANAESTSGETWTSTPTGYATTATVHKTNPQPPSNTKEGGFLICYKPYKRLSFLGWTMYPPTLFEGLVVHISR